MPSQKQEHKARVHSAISVFVILFIIASVFAVWSYLRLDATKQRLAEQKQPSTSQETTQPANSIVERVGRHIVLPEGDPLVVVVDDGYEALQEHAFFKSAAAGDIILLYPNKAFLYDPATDRIKNVGPLYFSDLNALAQSAQEPGLPEADEVLEVAVRNGSQVAGRAGETGDVLDADDAYEVVEVGNAARYDYTETILVNLTEFDVSELADEYNATVVTELPDGEASSDADVVLILGNDGE